jgi:dihydroorotate dehydrogenase electron transfer subunit
LCDVYITTEDGSCQTKGFVTDVLKNISYDYYFACGPYEMLKAVYFLNRDKNIDGQLSFEARMGCGFGACMSCTCKTLTKYKRLCVEGPVLNSNEVIF